MAVANQKPMDFARSRHPPFDESITRGDQGGQRPLVVVLLVAYLESQVHEKKKDHGAGSGLIAFLDPVTDDLHGPQCDRPHRSDIRSDVLTEPGAIVDGFHGHVVVARQAGPEVP